jgi:hypothetical protein
MNWRLIGWTGLMVWSMGCKRLPAMEGDEPGECSDEADNDRNGKFDCDDPNCASSPVCQSDEDTGGGEGAGSGDGSSGGTTDDGPGDRDGDGVLDDEDCAPDDPEVSPAAEEEPYDGIDNDCNPDTLDDDFDQDGILAADDCDDGNADIGADAVERCFDPSQAKVRLIGEGGLGSALVVSGDIDGDGVDDITIGAATTSGSTGEVVVWSGADLFNEAAEPLARWSGRASYDYLGDTGALEVVGDLDGDGRADVAVNVPNADPGGFANAGMVAVLLTSDPVPWGTSSELASVASISVLGRSTGDKLGTSSTWNDLTGDGIPDLIVTAPQDDEGVANGGTIFIFTGGLDEAGDRSVNDADHRFFGSFQERLGDGQLKVIGDVNGDGSTELAIGSPSSDGEAGGAGVVFLLSDATAQPDANLADVATASLLGRSYEDGFGHGISAVSDLDGDGNADFVVGALKGDGAVTDSGSAYLFAGAAGWTGTHTIDDATVHWSGPNGLGRTGALPVALPSSSGGLPELVLSTPWAATGGHVAVLDGAQADVWAGGDPSGDATTWVRSRETDGLGSSVALWNNHLVVGAPSANEGDGAVVVLER